MSLQDLNLLPSQAKFQAVRMQMIRLNKKIMIWILAVWTVILIVVFGVDLVNKQLLSREQDKQKKVKAQYLALSDNVVVSQKLKYRAKMVGGVLADRFEYGKAFAAVNNLFPPEIVIENFSLQKQGSFKIDGNIPDLTKVKVFESMVMAINAGENPSFSEAVVNSIGIYQGRWNYGMEVTLK